MAYNRQRAANMSKMTVGQLKRFVDAGTLSSASAEYELAKRGVVYPVTQQRV